MSVLNGANGVAKWLAAVLMALTWFALALLAYGSVSSDIAVLQSKDLNFSQRLERIEAKIDRLLERP